MYSKYFFGRCDRNSVFNCCFYSNSVFCDWFSMLLSLYSFGFWSRFLVRDNCLYVLRNGLRVIFFSYYLFCFYLFILDSFNQKWLKLLGATPRLRLVCIFSLYMGAGLPSSWQLGTEFIILHESFLKHLSYYWRLCTLTLICVAFGNLSLSGNAMVMGWLGEAEPYLFWY